RRGAATRFLWPLSGSALVAANIGECVGTLGYSHACAVHSSAAVSWYSRKNTYLEILLPHSCNNLAVSTASGHGSIFSIDASPPPTPMYASNSCRRTAASSASPAAHPFNSASLPATGTPPL